MSLGSQRSEFECRLLFAGTMSTALGLGRKAVLGAITLGDKQKHECIQAAEYR